MKKNLMGAGYLALCFVAAASIASATTCSDGSELSPGAPNGQVANSCSITIDNLTFSNFAYVVAGQTTGNTQALSIDLVSATFTNGEVVLIFNPNLANNGNNQGIYDIHFAYEVSGGVLGASIIDNGTDSSIQEKNCTTGTVGDTSGTCTGTTLWSVTAGSTGGSQNDSCGPGTSTTGTGNNTCNYGTGANPVWVFKDISIGTTTSGGFQVLASDDHLTSFSEDNLVPEPVTTSLVGLGLLGIGLLGRRLRK
jgi:hypothetical protein